VGGHLDRRKRDGLRHGYLYRGCQHHGIRKVRDVDNCWKDVHGHPGERCVHVHPDTVRDHRTNHRGVGHHHGHDASRLHVDRLDDERMGNGLGLGHGLRNGELFGAGQHERDGALWPDRHRWRVRRRQSVGNHHVDRLEVAKLAGAAFVDAAPGDHSGPVTKVPARVTEISHIPAVVSHYDPHCHRLRELRMDPAPVARRPIPWMSTSVSVFVFALSPAVRHSLFLILKVAVLYFAAGVSG
jgi:hypothetical protein